MTGVGTIDSLHRTSGAPSSALNPFVCGEPRFLDEELQTLCRNNGAAAAWQKAFDQYGVGAPSRVEGSFAVALTARDRVFLAIDRFAIQTLCYCQTGNQLRFAVRADALATAEAEIDIQALFNYLFFHVIPSPRTIYRDVFRLPPAHYALFENAKLTVAPYWTPTFEENVRKPFDQLRDEFRKTLRDSVRDQLGSGKVGCFLSGGTDSSTVAGSLGQVSGQPADTYSIGFDAQGYDEMEYARIAARHFNTNHHEHYITADDLVVSIPKVAASYDQPFGNSSALPAYYCAQMAKADGVGKMLGGDGGDELFGGNTRYTKQKIFEWYGVLPGPFRTNLMEPVFGARKFERFSAFS